MRCISSVCPLRESFGALTALFQINDKMLHAGLPDLGLVGRTSARIATEHLLTHVLVLFIVALVALYGIRGRRFKTHKQAEKLARATVVGSGALLAADKSSAAALREAIAWLHP